MDFTEFDEKKFSDVVSGSWDEDTAAFVKLLKQASLDVYKELLAAVSMEPLVLSTKNNFSIPSSMPAEVLAAIKAITIKFADVVSASGYNKIYPTIHQGAAGSNIIDVLRKFPNLASLNLDTTSVTDGSNAWCPIIAAYLKDYHKLQTLRVKRIKKYPLSTDELVQMLRDLPLTYSIPPLIPRAPIAPAMGQADDPQFYGNGSEDEREGEIKRRSEMNADELNIEKVSRSLGVRGVLERVSTAGDEDWVWVFQQGKWVGEDTGLQWVVMPLDSLHGIARLAYIPRGYMRVNMELELGTMVIMPFGYVVMSFSREEIKGMDREEVEKWRRTAFARHAT